MPIDIYQDSERKNQHIYFYCLSRKTVRHRNMEVSSIFFKQKMSCCCFLRRGCLGHEVNKQTVWTTVYVLSISMYLGCIWLKNMKVYIFHKIVLVFQTSCICGSKFIFVSDPFFHNSSSGFKKLFWIVTSVSDVNIR